MGDTSGVKKNGWHTKVGEPMTHDPEEKVPSAVKMPWKLIGTTFLDPIEGVWYEVTKVYPYMVVGKKTYEPNGSTSKLEKCFTVGDLVTFGVLK
jgi:hypothetical protein